MYKDLSLKEKAKVLLYGGKLGLTSVEDIAKLYDEATGHTFQTKGLMEVGNYSNRPTLNEYLAKRAAEEQELYYLQGSRNRNTSKILSRPLTNIEKALYLDKISSLRNLLNLYIYELSKRANISYSKAKDMLKNLKYPAQWKGEYEYWFNMFSDALNNIDEFNYILNTNNIYSPNCIATALDNNPNSGHYVTGNLSFRANPEKYGWKETNLNNIKPGGLILKYSIVGYPDHAMIYDHSENDWPYVNYSPGDTSNPEKYKKYQQLWFSPENAYYYNFVGNSADSTRWTNEYNLLYGTLYAKGGNLILDNNGYYAHPKYNKEGTTNDMLIKGDSTGTNITMRGIPFKIAAWDNLGNYQELEPNGEYYFPGSMVREHALQEGGNTLKYLNVPEYNIALYNTVSPLGDFPNFWGALAYRKLVKDKLKNGNIYERDYSVGNTQGEKTAMAAWAKRLGIPYDELDLPVYNGDTVTLPYNLVLEIPYDTNMLKNRIQLNKALLDKYSKYRYSDVVDAAIKADLYNLDKLRETYKTGKPVGQTEFGWNSRLLVNNGEIIPIENIQSPLNVLGNYNVRYSPEERRLYYSDEYDFNQFENFVPGEPYRIRGYIDLDNNKALGGNLFKKGGIYINPKNKGKLTETMRRTGKSKYELAHSKNPLTRKRALFAINASHWKHDEGGHLFLENGQIFKRPLDDLTGRNILTSPILPPKSYYEQFTIPEIEPKKPQPLQPIEGTYGNKYSELIPMSDGTYVNNPINKGLQLDWRTHALEFAPFLAIGAGPAIGSTATWLASKPALYNLGRMTLGSEIGGRSVDLASRAFTGNTWGLNVGNVVEDITGWNPNNTMVGLFVTDLINPGYTMNWWNKIGNLGLMSAPVISRTKYRTTNHNEPSVLETLSVDTKNLRRKLSKGLLSKILLENGNIRPLSGENGSLTFTDVHPRKAPYYILADVPIDLTLEGIGSIANFDKKPFSTRYKLPKDYSLNIYDDNVKVYRKNGNKYDLVDKEFLFNTPELRFDLINSNKKFRNTKDLKLSDHHIVLSEPPIQTLESSTFYLEDIISKDEMFRLQDFNPNFLYKEYYGDIFPDANLNSDEYATMLKNAIRNTDSPSKIAEDVGILAQRFYTNKYGIKPFALSEQEWSNLGQSILEKQRQLGNNVFFHSTLNEPFSNIDNLKLNLVNNGFLGKGFYLSDLPSSDYGPVVLPFSVPQGKQVILTKGNNRLRADIKEVDDFLKNITKSRFKWTKEGFKEKPYGYWPGIQETSKDPKGWNNLIKNLDFDLVKSKESSKGIGLTYPEILIPPDKTYRLEMLFKNPSLMKHGGFIYS